MADFTGAMFGDHSGHLRMVITYWDMAAGLVNNGAISPELFNDTNGEHIGVFAKLEPLLGEIRAAYGSQFAVNFEKLIDATPDGRKRTTEARERIKQSARSFQQGRPRSNVSPTADWNNVRQVLEQKVRDRWQRRHSACA
jgi:hypothetical protein